MRGILCVLLLMWIVEVGRGEAVSREDFPKDFVFGSGTSAYQVEGAAAEDGRTPSIWDTAAHAGKETGDVAADEYHKYKEDVKQMKEMGLEGYRFSISWSRLLPKGRGEINPKGLEYYNNLINELISYGIQPHVTLFHYDLPQVLEDEYSGWLNPKILDDFAAYAEVCFREFGDRVSHWTTLNEANVFALGSYDVGWYPPQRCSYPFGVCSHGDSTSEPYTVAHHCLLAHIAVVSLYKRKYQEKQQGLIGLNIFMYHLVPLTNSTMDISATRRAQDYYSGWFINPLIYGDYPDTMKKFSGVKLPRFSRSQSRQLIGSFDFIGLNYYSTLFVEDSPSNITLLQRDIVKDMSVKLTVKTEEDFDAKMAVVANGLQGVLEKLKQVYGNPPIYIHENGYPMPHNSPLDDTPRVKHLSAHLGSLLNALRNGSNTRGYFTWSFVDVFELLDSGYTSSYGMYYVDFEDKDRRRYPKLSARWYSNFLKRRRHACKLISVT